MEEKRHRSWRADHPEGLEKVKVVEEVTLWHVLRAWPNLYPWEQAKGMVSPKPSARTVHFVNRLDRGTSGIVCVAGSAAAAAELGRRWVERALGQTDSNPPT